ncbi:MAG: sodium-dependent transporter [Ignavibacteria bacterium]|nr:MAG: sodium-dependent transporter [Ignavibacteria bacterium]
MKNFLLLIAIALGVLLPYGHEYVFLIRYFLMVLLFFSFLDISTNKEVIKQSHFVILGTIVLTPLLLFYLINFFNHTLAQTVFITAIAPTAIAAPVIISLKKGRVEYVMFSLLLNNIAVALLIPFLLPLVASSSKPVYVSDILFPVLVTISIPFILAQLTRFVLPKIWKFLVEWKDSSFYILVANIYIAVSDATTYIREELTSNLTIVFMIAAVSALLCIFYFGLGWLIGGKNYRAEASQSLGQKNNAFTIWIALTFMSPLAALGPVFYVLFQNTYISYTLYQFNKKLNDESVSKQL